MFSFPLKGLDFFPPEGGTGRRGRSSVFFAFPAQCVVGKWKFNWLGQFPIGSLSVLFLHQTEAPTWYLQYWQLFLVLMLISQSLLPLHTKDLFLAFYRNQGLIDSCAIHIFLPNL